MPARSIRKCFPMRVTVVRSTCLCCMCSPWAMCNTTGAKPGMHCRKFSVFSLAAITKPAAQEGAEAMDEDDSVYELTPQDIQRELAAQQRKHRYNDAGLRTRDRCDAHRLLTRRLHAE